MHRLIELVVHAPAELYPGDVLQNGVQIIGMTLQEGVLDLIVHNDRTVL
jgi:hypothetical protein